MKTEFPVVVRAKAALAEAEQAYLQVLWDGGDDEALKKPFFAMADARRYLKEVEVAVAVNK